MAKWGKVPMGRGERKRQLSIRIALPRVGGGIWEDNRKFLFRTYWCWDISGSSKTKRPSGFWKDRSVGGDFSGPGLEKGIGYHLHKRRVIGCWVHWGPDYVARRTQSPYAMPTRPLPVTWLMIPTIRALMVNQNVLKVCFCSKNL